MQTTIRILLAILTAAVSVSFSVSSAEAFSWADNCYITVIVTRTKVIYEDLAQDGKIIARHPRTTYHGSLPVTLSEGDTFHFELRPFDGLDAHVLITSTMPFNIGHGFSGGEITRRSDLFTNYRESWEGIELKDEYYGSFGVYKAPALIYITAWPRVKEDPARDIDLPITIYICHRDPD